ncbi:MAG: radical SAM family heme chaperone HemW [Chitinophagaceae bacterium]|nr:radical SAM family heme chaperone HemW [Chitinophagaceae bacterium]
MAGIYIHIPFCKQACHYCNFHFSTTRNRMGEMTDAIISEIKLTPLFETAGEEKIDSLYFGGGTPSRLSLSDLDKLIDALRNRFSFADHPEITLEANPDDIDPMKLKDWISRGINRLSVGIQSFDEAELAWMNRAHDARDSIRCIQQIKEAGFTNFSADLIYGSPLMTIDSWQNNLDIVIQENIPHLSCYALTVEPRTALDKMIRLKKKEAVEPDAQAILFGELMMRLGEAGYEHYEISNFARPGMRSRHNSSYWKGTPYYGFGPSAHSYDGSQRRWNLANNALYIQSIQKGIIPFEAEVLTPVQQLNEYIMTALRTIEGIDLERVARQFGTGPEEQLRSSITKWKEGGKLVEEGRRIILTDNGKFFADGIASDLFF